MPVVMKKRRRRGNFVKNLKLYFTIIVISLIVALIYCYLTGDLPTLLKSLVTNVVREEVERAKKDAIEEMEEDATKKVKEDAAKELNNR